MKLPGMLVLAAALAAQVPNPTQVPNPSAGEPAPPPQSSGATPIFRVTVVSRTTKAINYHRRTGSTRVDFRGTALMPDARGEAKVESQTGSTKIETRVEHLTPATQFGPEYLTYVLWGITPEGRPVNLGELAVNGDDAKLLSTTELQTFGLIVTAEPYFAVTQPSDVVVAENFVREDTTGTIQPVDAKFELLPRGQYIADRGAYKPVPLDPKGPLQLAQAENAVEIARLAGAEKYAGDTFNKALVSLQNARDFLTKSKDRRRAENNAREAVQMAEDARIISFRRAREEQLAAERAASAQREADARAKAQRADEEARLQQERRAQADEAAAKAAQERAAAESARATALAAQEAARAEAERARFAAREAEEKRQQAEADKAALRERLRQQLNMVLETRETQRGLIVNISDVLFDFNQYTLKPGTREKLAKVAGILLAYPGLKVNLEGHTDSVGSDEYNLKLSQQRADAVRSYLVGQGVAADTIAAAGLGEADAVATNDTAAGRQQNRRVDMVVSGEPIGIGGAPSGAATSPAVEPPGPPRQ